VPWEAIEAQARDTAFQAAVIMGVAVLVGLACVMSVWSLQQLLKLLGLYSDFISFTRHRRKRR
jgi:hypothetical protein